MSFNVQFYTYSKRELSTVHPTTAGQTISCLANDTLDLLAPSVLLEWTGQQAATPTAYNYARIPSLGRWYWITGWSNVDGLWRADLSVDALASWATDIGRQEIYVFRSSSSYNLRIADTLYPSMAQRRLLSVALPKPWTIGGASASGAAANSGIIVLGIMSGNGVDYYGFTPAQLSDFMAYLFSHTYYDTVLGEFGAIEYPEAKVAINPMQYITSAKFIPMGISTPGYEGLQPWTLHTSDITGVNVGTVLLQSQQAYAFFEVTGTPVQYHTTTSYTDLQVTSDLLHPQADDRGDWLNMEPHTTMELYYPPFGMIPLDMSAVSQASTIRIRLTVDVWTATGVLDVILDPGTATEQILSRLSGPVGADIPLANILVTGHSTTELGANIIGGLTSAVNLAAGNVGGAPGILSAIHASVGTVATGRIPHVSTVGGQGSTAQMEGTPRLMVTSWLQAPDDLAGRGRPLCDKRIIANIPGYIMGDADEISLPCTATELETIKAAIRGGFWYGV